MTSMEIPVADLTADETEPLLTPEDVAARLSVETSWVYRAARNGTIPCVRVGRWVRFERDAVQAFIAKGGTGE